MPIPSSIRKYFWDINTTRSSPKSHPEYYISRILEFGDMEAFVWLKETFGLKVIKNSIRNLRISRKSKGFWKSQLQQENV